MLRFFFWARSQNLQKATIFIMSVCPFVRVSALNLAPTGRMFMKFDILSIFRKSVEKI